MKDVQDRTAGALNLLRASLALFILGHLVGYYLFDNHWAVMPWRCLPWWYPAVWLIGLLTIERFSGRLADVATGLVHSRWKAIVAMTAVLLLVVAFRFDSFVFGGGNLRVAQIAQAETIIYRWFEYGTVGVVSWLFRAFTFFGLKADAAGVLGWKVVSFLCALASAVAAWKLAQILSPERSRRLLLFIIVFFGPQALLCFGFVGVEPAVVAFSIWFAFLAARLNAGFTTNRLLGIWGLTILGILFHHSLAFLVPAAAYVSFQRLSHRRRQVALAATLVSYSAVFVAAYYWGNTHPDYSRFLLFLRGTNPHGDYGLFSLRHLSDFGQILFLAAPNVIVIVYLAFFSTGRSSESVWARNWATALLWSLSGMTALFTANPFSSAMFDFPRLVAYLAPLSFLLAVLLSGLDWQSHSVRRLVLTAAAGSVFVLLSYLPAYTRIDLADAFAVDYLERHPTYYREGILAFRDAYFYNESFDRATDWEGRLSVKAPEGLLFEGAVGLARLDKKAEAITELYRLDAQYMYWTEPKVLLAQLLLEKGQYPQAKKIIDRCLGLEPFAMEHLVNLYGYYRDTRSYSQALATIATAQEIYPGNRELVVDKMIVLYRSGKFEVAANLADSLIGVDPALAYPYLIRGLVLESKDSTRAAVKSYDEFVRLDAKEAALYNIPQRLDSLRIRFTD